MTPAPLFCGTVRHVLGLGLSTAGFALVAVGSPSPVSEVLTWGLAVVTGLSAGHGVFLAHGNAKRRPACVEPVEVQAGFQGLGHRQTGVWSGPQPHVPAPSQQVWATPPGWQTTPRRNGTLFTRPDGRQFLVTDRPEEGERGVPVVVFTPGVPRPPTRQGSCWLLTGAREDVARLLEVM
jgi:hypothetical protein